MSIINRMRKVSRQDVYTKPLLPAVLVFAALMVIIMVSWRTAGQDVTDQQKSVVSENAAFVESTVLQRFGMYENTLRAANGLFLSSDFVSRDEWSKFIGSMDLSVRFPGVRSVGYIKLVNNADKDTYEAANRADTVPTFALNPAGDRSVYAPVTYVVPTAGQPVDVRTAPILGFDMYSEPQRKAAMDAAAASGQPTLSGTVNLVQTGTGRLDGFYMFVPLFKEGVPLSNDAERRTALTGFFYTPFSNDGVFSSLFTITQPNFGFSIYDGPASTKNRIYQSRADINEPYFNQLKQGSINLYGQSWTIVYKAKAEIVPYAIRARPLSVLTGGSIFAAALALIIYLLIQRRTRSLTYREQKKLEEAKDDLLSLASHQLRTPATAVKQYVSMVKEGFAGRVGSEQRKLLQMAYDSNERQLTIVDDLLYVARIDAGKTVLKHERVNIGQLLVSVMDDQRSIVKGRKQTVVFKRPPKPIYVELDPHYVRMIFENLLSNASKYSYEGKKIILTIAKSQDEVTVDFIDNGVGIDPADFPNVFLKFSRIPNELTRNIAGSGIGLYLAKQLAILHGGDVTFTSQFGEGSTFTLSLPRKNER